MIYCDKILYSLFYIIIFIGGIIKMKKKILAAFIACVMLLTLLPALSLPVAANLEYEQTFRVVDLPNSARVNLGPLGRDDGSGAPGAPSGNYLVWWDNGGSNQANGSSRYVEFSVPNVPSAGKYALDFYWYTRGDGPGSINTRKMAINQTTNNGRRDNAILLRFDPTQAGVWEYFTYVADLQAGTNTIRLWFDNTSPTNTWLILDHMRVRGPGELVNVKTASNKGGIAAGGGSYMIGETITLTAKSYNYYTFNGWYEGDTLVSTLASHTFTVAGETTLEARFNAGDMPFDANTAAEQAMLDYLNVYLRDRGIRSSQGQFASGANNNFGGTGAQMLQQYGLRAWSDLSDPATIGTGDNGEVGYWHSANAYEALNTAYEMTDDPVQKALYKEIMHGYRIRKMSSGFSWPSNGNWRNNTFTDDLLWWSNAFTRSYMLTGDIEFLNDGRMIYDRCWVRAWDASQSSRWLTTNFTARETSAGGTSQRLTAGGLTWNLNTTTTVNSAQNLQNVGATNGWGLEKNNATNWNGALNAARLALIYKDNPELEEQFLSYISVSGNQTKYAGDFHVVTGSAGNRIITDKKTGVQYTNLSDMYIAQAKMIFDWSWENLVIEKTGANRGRLTDNYHITSGRRDWQFTYNYGLAGHAGVEIWGLTGDTKYLDQSYVILEHAWERQFTRSDGLTMRDEGGMDGGDGAAFRLALVRGMGRIINDDALLAADDRFEGFKKYMFANAHQAWSNRRPSDGLIGSDLIVTLDDSVRIHACIAAFLPQMLWYTGYDPNADYSDYFDVDKLAWIPAWGAEYEGGKVYLAQSAKRANIDFGHTNSDLGSPADGSLGTHSVFWNSGGNANEPVGETRYIEWEIEVETAGKYQLDFRWYTRENNLRSINVNGGAAADLWFWNSVQQTNPVSRDNWGWEYSTVYADLTAGLNSIKVWLNQNDPRVFHDRNYTAGNMWGAGTNVGGIQGWLFIDYLKLSTVDGYAAADYTVVEEAIARAAALDPAAYEDFSGVTAAIAAVDYGSYISDYIITQEIVNAFAQAIDDAIDALITLEAAALRDALAAVVELLDEVDTVLAKPRGTNMTANLWANALAAFVPRLNAFADASSIWAGEETVVIDGITFAAADVNNWITNVKNIYNLLNAIV